MRVRIVLAAMVVPVAAYLGCMDLGSNPEILDQDGDNGPPTPTPPRCVPRDARGPLMEKCGQFVSLSGDDVTGDGSQKKPFATIGRALQEGDPVYVCASTAEPYVETLVIDKAGISIFGGLSCGDWTYNPEGKTSLSAKEGNIPLRITASGTLRMEDFIVTAQDVLAPGDSSIAILAEAGSALALYQCAVNAGKGADGADGEEAPVEAVAGMPGGDGEDGCFPSPVAFGGYGGDSICGGTDVSGGWGGDGLDLFHGGDGSSGLPFVGYAGQGGHSQTSGIPCLAGDAGQGGLVGSAGAGAHAGALGSLSQGGFVGVRGTDGLPGTFGQGGGGGGGGHVCGGSPFSGPGGGGGGAGGCGGAGGKGGYAGGASAGIVFLGADAARDMKLSKVSIRTADGGNGGRGAQGQLGGAGGQGGKPGKGDAEANACMGGPGGQGGRGGKGGGGRGGHSIGIAHKSVTSPDVAGVAFTLGNAGVGGLDLDPTSSGAAGVVSQVQPFD